LTTSRGYTDAPSIVPRNISRSRSADGACPGTAPRKPRARSRPAWRAGSP
jgi:hypothetical protein